MDDLAVNMPDIEPLRLRTASFNDIDSPLSQWRVIGPLRMKYVVELGGVLMVVAGDYYSRSTLKEHEK
jgi:hypothetical protein